MALSQSDSIATPTSYFIDESGHTGDLSSASGLDFAGQPIFALAAIGVPEPEALAAKLEELRAVHRCGPGELKSTMTRLAPFVFDLADALEQLNCHPFIELVDKRFFVAIHIVNRLLCGDLPIHAVPMPYRNAIAEFLTDGTEDDALSRYLDLCRNPTIEGVRDLLQHLWNWFDASDEEIARIAQFLVMEARDRAAVSRDPAPFLPIFDVTERNRKVWILPNFQCLTNIYARINKSRPEGLGGVRLIHDGQLQYAQVLTDAKMRMETSVGRRGVAVASVRRLSASRRRQPLHFEASARSPCLQAADLVAGCAMRFAKSALGDKASTSLRQAFMKLLGLGDPFTGQGINFVFTGASLARIKVPVF